MLIMLSPTAPPLDKTVLFADIAGSTQLYERLGDAMAHQLVNNCLQVMRREIEGSHGEVIKHTGDGLLAIFTNPNPAAEAALRMHHAVTEIPAAPQERVSVRIAFYSGPVIHRDQDVFGDTVNIAARLLEIASPGRAITAAESVRFLRHEWRSLTHPMQSRSLRGVSRLVDPFELVCESTGDLTVVQNLDVELSAPPELQLALGTTTLVLNTDRHSARLGRDSGADLRINDGRASREHAVIELRGEKFVLVDRSSNGTFIAIEGEREFILSHEEIVLRNCGRLALGRSCAESSQVIEFRHL